MTTLHDTLTSTSEGRRLYRREVMALALTETICELMEKRGVNREELAVRLDLTEDRVEYILDHGGAEFQSLSDLADIFTALDSRVVFTVEPL